MTEITLPLITLGALGDSINPCAIAVLVFLVTFLISIKKRGGKFLAIAFVYILFIYLTYFFAGLGLLSSVQKLNITYSVYRVAAIVVVLAGLVNIKEYFFSGKGFSLALPESKKPLIKKYIQKASIPSAIVLGIMVSLFELPCTGGIYLAVIGLLAEKATWTEGILYLLYYNLIFVFPLIIIVLLSFFSLSSETINSWRKKNKRGMRLVMGITMILLGILMWMS
ncbi:MAG: cytochrome c biogenesis protein CcdA [Candidatus Dojkabacteria bacterium]|jgi:cytochrome c biogenesis protein CcdA|nr:cytochrome c biogenesis protein CcdA [Candidatus Dojkabacteria bacterium]